MIVTMVCLYESMNDFHFIFDIIEFQNRELKTQNSKTMTISYKSGRSVLKTLTGRQLGREP